MSYTQLTCETRYQIYGLLKTGINQTQIAVIVEVDNSTISRELHCNKGKRGYRPNQAHQKAIKRRKKVKIRISEKEWQIVEEMLAID